jgi:hypothetical protein
MAEVFEHPEHIPAWHQAALGNMPNWDELLSGYAAAVDWPSAAYWEQLSKAYPDSLILLSVRDPEKWWDSASETIFRSLEMGAQRNPEWGAMMKEMFKHEFSMKPDKQSSIEAFVRHNQKVIDTAPKDRLLVWEAKDGWEPICDRLGLPVPDEPFPRVNTKEEFIARLSQRDE